MKYYSLRIIGFISCLLFVSCEQPTILSINTTSLTFDGGINNQSITITTNKSWTAKTNQDWLRVSPSSGEGNASISVFCEDNDTFESRTGTITIVSEELNQTISVAQSESKGLIVLQTVYDISNEAQTISVEIQSNVQYFVDIDNECKSWIKLESTKSLSTNVINLAISKNEEYDDREGKITIKQTDGSLSETVLIKQSHQDGLFVSSSEYRLSNEKHTLTIEVKANVDFDVKSNVNWIRHVETKGLGTAQIVLEVAANEEYEGRVGTISVSQNNGDLEGIVTIYQEENNGLFLSQSDFSLSDEAQTIEVEVLSNVDIDVVIPELCKDWISIVGTKGLSSKSYLFYVTKNETFDDRECSITFKQKNGSLCETLKIMQGQQNGLFLSTQEYDLSKEKQTLSIEVKSNVDFEVIPEVDWIKYVETKGLKTSNIILEILANGNSSREGTVVIKSKYVDWEGVITIRQKGDYSIILSQAEYSLSNEAQRIEVEINNSVDIEAIIPDSCKSWVSVYAFSSRYYYFNIEKNETYDNRECVITFKQKNGTQCETILIRQSQKDELIVEKTEYVISAQETLLPVTVRTNMTFDIILKDCKDWITVVQTKGLTTGTILLQVAKNPGKRRFGHITLDGGKIKRYIIITQGEDGFIEFECTYFAAFCKSFDNNNDGKISYEEASLVTSMYIRVSQISSMREIAYFNNLTKLTCEISNISSLDLSHNTALTTIKCDGNSNLRSLSVGDNNNLHYLNCSGNPLLSLDVSGCPSLDTLICAGSPLSYLDVGNNTKLKLLNCEGTRMTRLDVSKNYALNKLICSNNPLSSLVVGKNPNLTTIEVTNNSLTTLDVSDCTALSKLECNNLPHQQTGSLSNLDVSGCVALIELNCCFNKLSSLDVGGCTALAKLYCSSNELASLDVSNCLELRELKCPNNKLSLLDVSNNSALYYLNCLYNPSLSELWLKTGQVISDLYYDPAATIKYK